MKREGNAGLALRELRKASPQLKRAARDLAPRSPPAVRGWAKVFDVPPPASIATQPSKEAPDLPAFCEGDTESIVPDAPPPDATVPLRLAVAGPDPRLPRFASRSTGIGLSDERRLRAAVTREDETDRSEQ